MIKINRPECPNPTALAHNYKHPDNKKVLLNASHGKCMYCESSIGHVCFGDVEHIRPKSFYPHLEFVWENLGFVCTKCNNAKRDKFTETTPYVNPYDEDPEDHILAIGALLRHKAGSERGELTILDINLNRPNLIEKRDDKLRLIQRVIDACMRTSNATLKQNAVAELLKECGEDKEFSLVVKNLFKLHGLI